jgi:hypothetical protein
MTPEQVAAGLTEAQRAAVKHSPWTNRVGLSTKLNTLAALETKGIIEPGRTTFTPLGLEVKSILESKGGSQ